MTHGRVRMQQSARILLKPPTRHTEQNTDPSQRIRKQDYWWHHAPSELLPEEKVRLERIKAARAAESIARDARKRRVPDDLYDEEERRLYFRISRGLSGTTLDALAYLRSRQVQQSNESFVRARGISGEFIGSRWRPEMVARVGGAGVRMDIV